METLESKFPREVFLDISQMPMELIDSFLDGWNEYKLKHQGENLEGSIATDALSEK